MWSLPGRWLKRETGGCSGWPPAGPLSGRRHSSACQSRFWWNAPELEPEVQKKRWRLATFVSSDLLWHKHATVDPFNDQRETWNAARWWFSGRRRRSNLAELFHLFVSVWIEFLRHILHPEQRSSVFRPGLLHLVDGQPGV